MLLPCFPWILLPFVPVSAQSQGSDFFLHGLEVSAAVGFEVTLFLGIPVVGITPRAKYLLFVTTSSADIQATRKETSFLYRRDLTQ
jgi:hypothetical protein